MEDKRVKPFKWTDLRENASLQLPDGEVVKVHSTAQDYCIVRVPIARLTDLGRWKRQYLTHQWVTLTLDRLRPGLQIRLRDEGPSLYVAYDGLDGEPMAVRYRKLSSLEGCELRELAEVSVPQAIGQVDKSAATVV